MESFKLGSTSTPQLVANSYGTEGRDPSHGSSASGGDGYQPRHTIVPSSRLPDQHTAQKIKNQVRSRFRMSSDRHIVLQAELNLQTDECRLVLLYGLPEHCPVTPLAADRVVLHIQFADAWSIWIWCCIRFQIRTEFGAKVDCLLEQEQYLKGEATAAAADRAVIDYLMVHADNGGASQTTVSTGKDLDSQPQTDHQDTPCIK